jgi:pimeloyl-ACP methyl ester carboxylesterase
MICSWMWMSPIPGGTIATCSAPSPECSTLWVYDGTFRERWEALSVPTLLLYGERDPFMTRRRTEAWEALSGRNPHVSVVPIPDAGHLAWIDEPERVVEETERFLKST